MIAQVRSQMKKLKKLYTRRNVQFILLFTLHLFLGLFHSLFHAICSIFRSSCNFRSGSCERDSNKLQSIRVFNVYIYLVFAISCLHLCQYVEAISSNQNHLEILETYQAHP